MFGHVESVLTSEKRCTSCPKRGEGGNSGNARKKTFFFTGGVPLAIPSILLFMKKEIFGLFYLGSHKSVEWAGKTNVK